MVRIRIRIRRNMTRRARKIKRRMDATYSE
jgi:hypothetical protein